MPSYAPSLCLPGEMRSLFLWGQTQILHEVALMRYPRNTQCMPACPVGPADRTGVVKIFAFLDLEQN
jgi:hypothetical protein